MPLHSVLINEACDGLTPNELADFEQLVRIGVSIFGLRSGNNTFCPFGLASFYTTFSTDRVIMLYQLTEKRPSANLGSLSILSHFKGLPTLLQAFETTLVHLARQQVVEVDVSFSDDDFTDAVPYRWKCLH